MRCCVTNVRSIFLSLCLCPALLCGSASADEELSIGSELPEFAALPSVDDKQWKSDDFDDATVLIVAFTCNRCLYAIDYEERLKQLHEYCQQKGLSVQLLVVNSNYGRDESLDRMKTRSSEREFRFRYVKDEEQSVARAFGAVYTPEFFVFNRQKKLVYKGALDDSTNADEVTVNYVQEAVEAVVKGNPVEVNEVGARGCTIRFKRRQPNRKGSANQPS